jgi:2-keto-4-pentenoate hydratase
MGIGAFLVQPSSLTDGGIMTFEKEQKILEQAEKDRKPVDPISDLAAGGLSLEDAHAICEAIIEKRLQSGEKLAGFKVGFTNIAVREKMGFPDSTYGYLMDSMLLQNGADVSMGSLIAPKIECEICLRLGKDLKGKGLTVENVLSATEAVSGSFEICDARIRDWKCPYPDFFADNGFSGRIVLPGRWLPITQVDLLNETVTLVQDGKTLAEGRGEMAMGHPAKAVSWLAGKLEERGRGLKAGQIIMTGTLTPITPVQKGSDYAARFSTLGQVTVRFT